MLIVVVESRLCCCPDEMLMSVLWYYRLEHTGTAPLPRYIDREVFASRHRDVIPVKCIEDRCYVLTLNEYNRWHHCRYILHVLHVVFDYELTFEVLRSCNCQLLLFCYLQFWNCTTVTC